MNKKEVMFTNTRLSDRPFNDEGKNLLSTLGRLDQEIYVLEDITMMLKTHKHDLEEQNRDYLEIIKEFI